MNNLYINNSDTFNIISNNWKLNILFYYSNIFTNKNIINLIENSKKDFIKIAEKYKNNKNINFFIVDVIKEQMLWNKFWLHSIPSIHFIKNNLKIWSLENNININNIEKKIWTLI